MDIEVGVPRGGDENLVLGAVDQRFDASSMRG